MTYTGRMRPGRAMFCFGGLSLTAFTLVSANVVAQDTDEGVATSDVTAGGESEEPLKAATLETELEQLVGVAGGLTASDVARRTLRSSPALRVETARLGVARAEQEQARLGWYPRLTLTGRYTRLSEVDPPQIGVDGFNLVGTSAGAGPLPMGAPLVGVPSSALQFPVLVNQYLLQANLIIPISDYLLRTSQQVLAARESASAAEIQRRAAEHNVAANARLAYYGWVRVRLQAAVAAQTLKQAEAHLSAAKALLEAERVPKSDVLAAQAQRAGAQLLVDKTQIAERAAQQQLRALMREQREVTYEIGEPLEAAKVEKPLAPLREDYARAKRQRLELKVLEQRRAALRAQRKAVDTAKYPRVDAFGNAYYANPHPRVFPQDDRWTASWDLGVQVTWTPNEVPLTSARMASLNAQWAELEATRADLEDRLESDVRDARQAVEDARAAQRASTEQLEAAEEAYRVIRERYQYGRANNVDVADAETSLLSARLQRVNAWVDGHIAEVRLRHALGAKWE